MSIVPCTVVSTMAADKEVFDATTGLKRSTGLALLVALSLVFLASNHAAYSSYFQDDELDNLSWAPFIPASDLTRALLTPLFALHNFRPAAEFYFHVMGQGFDLDFPKYVVPIHVLHLLNVWLLWLLARRMGSSPFAASCGALFFAFHLALFDVYWKPMYVFDLSCGTFCLLSLLLYTHRQIILSFVAFWVAYKSKELAVMLPAVLAVYEFWLGKRRWQPLVPFFVTSLSFGLQAMILNPNVDNAYTLRFTWDALKTTVAFYSSNILLIHHAGFVVVPLGLWLGKPLVRFGIISMLLFMVPLIFLPGRVFAAYCYVPLIGLALAVAGFVRRERIAVPLVLLLLWLSWNLVRLGGKQRHALEIAEENRAYVTALADFVRSSPETRSFVYEGRPSSFEQWGTSGALKYLSGGKDIQLVSIEELNANQTPIPSGAAILKWDAASRKLDITQRQ